MAFICVAPVGAARATSAPPPAQVIEIEVRGAVALVTVTRRLPGSRRSGDAREEILDLALPRDARLLDVDVDLEGNGRFDRAQPSPGERAHEGYAEATRALAVTPRVLSFDDEATVRVRVALRQQKPNQSASIRYRFSTLVHLAGRRAEIALLPTPDAPGPLARVTVRADLGQDVASIAIAEHVHPIARGAAAVATEPELSTDHAWLVALALDRDQARAAPSPSRFTALAARAPKPSASGTTALACAVGLTPAPSQALPDRVLFLIDRSRSVGPGGLEAERDAAKRLLLALPPSTMWNAMFFDRGQSQLFPAPRTATHQAMASLDDEMVTARLANGTDLRGALKATGDLLRREPAAFGPRALLVILSDGAVRSGSAGGAAATQPPETPPRTHGAAMPRERLPAKRSVAAAAPDLLGVVPGVDLMIAALSVRPNDDPPVSPDERRALQSVAARGRLGGIERALRVGELETALPEALAALQMGGDAFALRLDLRDGAEVVAPTISPGAGTATIVSVKGKARPWVPAALLAETGAQTHSVPLHVVSVEPGWLVEPAAPETRLFVGPAMATLVEPVARRGAEVEAPGPSGFLERSVVRDALSLAFTPRARACYLNRSAATPADRDLAGRVRLALDLIRGEVDDARVESSTLGRPAIEACLREAAFAFNVPRTYRNDERVTAVLNLVFRPRSPERQPSTSAPGVSREIDLLVDGALGTGGAPGLSAAEQAKALLTPSDAPAGNKEERRDRGPER